MHLIITIPNFRNVRGTYRQLWINLIRPNMSHTRDIYFPCHIRSDNGIMHFVSLIFFGYMTRLVLLCCLFINVAKLIIMLCWLYFYCIFVVCYVYVYGGILCNILPVWLHVLFLFLFSFCILFGDSSPENSLNVSDRSTQAVSVLMLGSFGRRGTIGISSSTK